MPRQHKRVRMSHEPAGTLASAPQRLDTQRPAKGRASQAWLPPPTHPCPAPRAVPRSLSSPRFHLFIFPSRAGKGIFRAAKTQPWVRALRRGERAPTAARLLFPGSAVGKSHSRNRGGTGSPTRVSAEHRDTPIATRGCYPRFRGGHLVVQDQSPGRRRAGRAGQSVDAAHCTYECWRFSACAASVQDYAVSALPGGARLTPQHPRNAGDRGIILHLNNSDLFTAQYQAGKSLNFQVCLSWGLAKQNSFAKAGRGILTGSTPLQPQLRSAPHRPFPSLLVHAVHPFGNSNSALKILLVLLKARADPCLRLQCLKQNLFPTRRF